MPASPVPEDARRNLPSRVRMAVPACSDVAPRSRNAVAKAADCLAVRPNWIADPPPSFRASMMSRSLVAALSASSFRVATKASMSFTPRPRLFLSLARALA